jgi:sarcosine oxidase
MLFPERCVEAFLTQALQQGACLQSNEAVKGWTVSARGIELRTSYGTYQIDRLVVAAGPWLPSLGGSLGVTLPLMIERQLSHWFAPTRGLDERFGASRCPIGLWETTPDGVFATLPNDGHGVKCGTHHAGVTTTAEVVERTVSDAENDSARILLNDVMPGAGGRLVDSRVCLYTNTADRHFIIDWLAGERVLVVSPCSGHGFKFASSIGEIVSQLVLEGRSWLDLSPFSLSRFQ